MPYPIDPAERTGSQVAVSPRAMRFLAFLLWRWLQKVLKYLNASAFSSNSHAFGAVFGS